MLDYIEEQRSQSRKKRQKKTKVAVLVVAIVAMMSASIGIVRAPLLTIENVVIEGNRLVEQEAIAEAIQTALNSRGMISEAVFPNDSALLAMVGNNSIENRVGTEIPVIKTIDVSTNVVTKTLSAHIVERDQYGIWCMGIDDTMEITNEQCWWFDSEGVLFMKGPATQGGLIRKVLDTSGTEIPLGQGVLEKKQFNHLKEIFQFLEDTGLNIKNLLLKNRHSVEIETDDPQFPTIIFSLRLDPSFAIAGMQTIGDSIESLEYIDLRTKNRVYYK